MLSYKTILAIQILFLLNKEEKKGLSISDLKLRAKLNALGIGQAVRQLIKYGWLASDNRNRHSVTAHARTRTLYDLVLVMDGAIVMGQNVNPDEIPFWGTTAKECIPHTVKFNEGIGRRFEDMLKNITVLELITEVELH